jgi:toxin ParE1/3/4
MASTAKPVRVAQQAQADIDQAIALYLQDAGEATTLRFLDALEDAFALLAHNPGLGSPRYATELQLPGVRCWPLRPWPQLIFYVEQEQELVVFRMLHGARDIPSTLGEP